MVISDIINKMCEKLHICISLIDISAVHFVTSSVVLKLLIQIEIILVRKRSQGWRKNASRSLTNYKNMSKVNFFQDIPNTSSAPDPVMPFLPEQTPRVSEQSHEICTRKIKIIYGNQLCDEKLNEHVQMLLQHDMSGAIAPAATA